MVMHSAAQSNPKGGTWKGSLLLLTLILFSGLSVNIMGRTVSFIVLPLIAIFLWPRLDNPIASIVLILLFGLLLDIISAGPLGLWPLVFLTIFTLFRPHLRLKRHQFGPSFGQWFGALTLSVVLAFFLGWFALEQRPDITALLMNAAAAIIAFPLVYGLRHVGAQLLTDADGRGL